MILGQSTEVPSIVLFRKLRGDLFVCHVTGAQKHNHDLDGTPKRK